MGSHRSPGGMQLVESSEGLHPAPLPAARTVLGQRDGEVGLAVAGWTRQARGASGQGHSRRPEMAKHKSWFSPRVRHGLAKPSRGQAQRNGASGRNLTLPLSELVFVLGSPRARAAPTSLCRTRPAPRDGGTGGVALELGLWPGSDACERRAGALFWGPGVKDRSGFSAKHTMQGQGSPVGNGASSRGLCATVFALPSCLGLEMQSSWGQQRERWGTESTCAPQHRSRAPRQCWGARTVTHVLACVPHRSLMSPLPWCGHTLDIPAAPHASTRVPAPEHVATGQQRTSRSTQRCSSSCCQCGWKMPFGQEPPGFFQPCPGKKKKAHKTPVVAVAKRKRQIRARLELAPRPPRDERRLRESLPVPCGQRTPKILTRPCAARSHGPKSQQELAAPVLPARWSSGDGGAAGSRAGCSLITSVLQNLPPPLATPVSRCSFSAGWGIAAFPPD